METYARFEKSIALVALLFNVLVTSFAKELSADVGALRCTANNLAASIGTLRCTANNLAASIGTVVIGALVVGVLSTGVINALTAKLLAFWTRSNTHAECKM
jgi:hypothetical protein